MKTQFIIWNGCDSYVEVERALERGYNFDGEKLYTRTDAFTPFAAVEIDIDDLPLLDGGDEGERDFDGIFGTESGRYYRAA